MALYSTKHFPVTVILLISNPLPRVRGLDCQLGTNALTTKKKKKKKIKSGAVVSRLDYCAGDPFSIPAGPGTEFSTGIQFWVIT